MSRIIWRRLLINENICSLFNGSATDGPMIGGTLIGRVIIKPKSIERSIGRLIALRKPQIGIFSTKVNTR